MIHFGTIIKSEYTSKRGHNKLMRKLNRTLMIRHALRRLPKHFEHVPETYPGSGGYRYKRRGTKYTEDKERKHGHRRPNVLTGKLRQAVLSRVKVTSTKDHGTLRTRGTSDHPLSDWQRREIEIRSRKEFIEDVKWQQREYARLGKTDDYRDKRRFRTAG